MSVPCRNDWCVALAGVESAYCAIHAKRPDLRLHEGHPTCIGVDCKACKGTGECIDCGGDGDCTCHCGDVHDCHECDGSGDCQQCKRDRRRNEADENYIRCAFDVGWQPFDVDREWERW